MKSIGVVKGRFERGARLGVRERKVLAKEVGCSETDLKKYMCRRHLWSAFFRIGEDVTVGIARGVKAERNISRPQTVRDRHGR